MLLSGCAQSGMPLFLQLLCAPQIHTPGCYCTPLEEKKKKAVSQ
jgi:hypothetical protein